MKFNRNFSPRLPLSNLIRFFRVRVPIFAFITVGIITNLNAAEILNGYDVKKSAGTLDLRSDTLDFSSLKIAILDNGFSGFSSGTPLLPGGTVLLEGAGNPLGASNHGMVMSQIVWEAMGKPVRAPRFYLINTNGFTNFKGAIDQVNSENIDIVLYSQVWLLGSNGDGTGFINSLVKKALQNSSQRIWVNAAGNFGGRVWEGSVDEASTQCLPFEALLDDIQVQITLLWNDFSESEQTYTHKDLDLQVENSSGEALGISNKRQKGIASTSDEDGLSGYSREELLLANLQRGKYCIRVTQISSNFSPTRDKVRVAIKTDRQGAVRLGNEFSDNNEIFAPADLSEVLAVADETSTSSKCSHDCQKIQEKPDVTVSNAVVRLSDGNQFAGSSTAAAIVAGAVAVWKSIEPGLTRNKLWTQVRSWKDFSQNTSSPSTDRLVTRPFSDFRRLSVQEISLIDGVIRDALPIDSLYFRNQNGLLRVHSTKSAAQYLKRTDLQLSQSEKLLWHPISGEFKKITLTQLNSARSPWVLWTSGNEAEPVTSDRREAPSTRWMFQAKDLLPTR